jgi:nucleoside-diphosphate-sugar epimerase
VKVLVTGATGMLGRRTAEALLGRGDEVTVLQRRPSELPCREILGDISDRDLVGLATSGQDAVVHLAAKVDVVGPWEEFALANIGGTDAVVAGCLAAGVRSLVHVSSPAVAHAGHALVGVGAEPADPERARGAYARSKAAAEQLALAADSPELAVLCVRPHLVWGPGDTQLVGRVVARARAGRLPMIGRGSALIDSTYVDNAVDALVAALDACPRHHGEAIVVSNGEPRTVAEILTRLCLAAGAPQPRRHIPVAVAGLVGAGVDRLWRALDRRDTPPLTAFLVEQLTTAHWFDQRHTRDVLGWTPRIALDAGFDALARWYASTASR